MATCKTCEHWNEKYMKCENQEQAASEAEYYMCPPDNICDLYEEKQADEGIMELKPCPFCGGKATERRAVSYPEFWVKCCVCGAEGPVRGTPESAAEAWNRRAE